MAKFKDIMQGTRAVKVIDLPLANVTFGVQKDTTEQIRERELNPDAYRARKVGLRALLPFERERVLELACNRTKERGGTPDESSPLYRHALAIYTVAAACVDPDAQPGTDAELYFGDTIEDAAEALRKSAHMTDDVVFYLREMQECWQDQINPQALTIADSELYEVTQKGAADADFFHYFRPGMLVNLAHILALQLLASLEDKLPDSPASTSSSTQGSSSANDSVH
jgi:hypothetical protein